jgi:F420-non-reducing hydrogenase iron-sulfur subunit
LLDQIGLGGERAAMVNLSSAMGAQFAEKVTEMSEKVRELGPNPLNKSQIANRKMEVADDNC